MHVFQYDFVKVVGTSSETPLLRFNMFASISGGAVTIDGRACFTELEVDSYRGLMYSSMTEGANDEIIRGASSHNAEEFTKALDELERIMNTPATPAI